MTLTITKGFIVLQSKPLTEILCSEISARDIALSMAQLGTLTGPYEIRRAKLTTFESVGLTVVWPTIYPS